MHMRRFQFCTSISHFSISSLQCKNSHLKLINTSTCFFCNLVTWTFAVTANSNADILGVNVRGYIFFIQKTLNSFAFPFTTRYGNMIILVKLLPKLVFSCWEAFLKRYCGSFVLSSTPNKFKMKYTGVSVCWTVNVSLMGTSLCTEYPRLCKCSDLSCKPPISQLCPWALNMAWWTYFGLTRIMT